MRARDDDDTVGRRDAPRGGDGNNYRGTTDEKMWGIVLETPASSYYLTDSVLCDVMLMRWGVIFFCEKRDRELTWGPWTGLEEITKQ